MGGTEVLLKLEKIAELIEVDAKLAIEAEVLLEVANSIVISNLKERKSPAAHAYNSLKNCMAISLALSLARLFDFGTRRYSLEDKDVASLPVLVEWLKREEIRAALCLAARNWTPHLPTLADSQERACSTAIARALSEFDAVGATIEGQAAVAALKLFRDRVLAHSLLGTVEDALPTYHQLFLLVKVSSKVADQLRFAVLGRTECMDDHREAQQESAEQFWQSALSAM